MSTHVMATPAPAAPGTVRIHDLLCLTDLSPLSQPAFEHARFLAERFQAELTVYHAVETFEGAHPHLTFGIGQELSRSAEERANAFLTAEVQRVAARCSVRVEQVPSAAEAVVEMVRGRRPDLTVMASHGRRGLSHLLLGSVTEEVVQRAHTPVLCVRDRPLTPWRKRRTSPSCPSRPRSTGDGPGSGSSTPRRWSTRTSS
ncbi:MAG TPA: universal stress protein [Vicinamibacteria bacterium]|nr:universal stress protein [Vicinamibacteria bacterium]